MKEADLATGHVPSREQIPERYSRIYAEIDLNAVRSNIERMKENLGPDTKIIAVVKADAYGHGAVAVARELEGYPYVSGFGVATFEEAISLRRAGIARPILVLGYVFPCCYREAICQEIRLALFRRDTIKELQKAAKALREEGISKKPKIHIKVDTGMSRIGVRPDEEGLALAEEVLRVEEIEVEGIFTHFARADEEDKSAALKQFSLFRNFIRRIKERTGREIPVKHCANSAGIIELPETGLDAVRAGIILYGLWPSEQVRRDLVPLTPVMSLYSTVVYLKDIEPGTQVSYGGTFTATEKMRIATIPAGYADGYPRALSGKGYVLIRGKKAPVLGRVCMDQFMVDVTGIKDTAIGDRVTLIGEDGGERITMEQAGALSGRFNYEFACCIGKRVPRIYLKDGKILCCQEDCTESVPDFS